MAEVAACNKTILWMKSNGRMIPERICMRIKEPNAKRRDISRVPGKSNRLIGGTRCRVTMHGSRRQIREMRLRRAVLCRHAPPETEQTENSRHLIGKKLLQEKGEQMFLLKREERFVRTTEQQPEKGPAPRMRRREREREEAKKQRKTWTGGTRSQIPAG